MTLQYKLIAALVALLFVFSGGYATAHKILKPKLEKERLLNNQLRATNANNDLAMQKLATDYLDMNTQCAKRLLAKNRVSERVRRIDGLNGGDDVASHNTGSTGNAVLDELNGMFPDLR